MSQTFSCCTPLKDSVLNFCNDTTLAQDMFATFLVFFQQMSDFCPIKLYLNHEVMFLAANVLVCSQVDY